MEIRAERHLADGLASMRARGLLVREADPEQSAMVVFAAVQGGLLLARTRQDVEPLRVALDAAYRQLRSFGGQRLTRPWSGGRGAPG
ncbi:LmrA/YxaF family transcription factor [Nonomuraea gerenzanensis]|uniref:Transcriptional regulator, TetR family n=1 Tax=Nonomuraea gerenzanensis TaxID=93944 RepID=A0A1M4E1E2_9ACTN|nr:hypothetical protein [Nonomuraea gerenzanensis]UBU14874.1 hypothetical protein LCN96_07580 [Nonomuraea gerenzanensis]SBO92608.1 Transcriptional regulator, TetR family [Nonomuraea gerenzanensis]